VRVVGQMCDALAHRGPDDAGVWQSPSGNAVLGHRRLAVIDLSPLGHNPMSLDNGRLWITFNGEIYNFRELREELEAEGYAFRSQTDTEVILAAYDRWGTACVERLVGMFALALWDEPKRRLWLVRDRLGKKPLYYAATEGSLCFGSELKALLANPSVPRDIDSDALSLYLRYGYIASPYSIYRAVRKLPPAHELQWEDGRFSVRRYWDPVAIARTPVACADAAAIDGLQERLTTAVRQRMIADVPVGAFLSGGIDSSLVVALMTEQSRARVQTFSIRFDNPAFNEADHAARVAQYLGTDHYEETCDNRQLVEIAGRLPDLFDEPFADSSAVPTYIVSRIARTRATVALSGDGGDELFLGYTRYGYWEKSRAVFSLPVPVHRAAALGLRALPGRRFSRIADLVDADGQDGYGRFITWWSPRETAGMMGRRPTDQPSYADALKRADGISPSNLPGLLDVVSYLPEDILTKVDRASMAVSLEVRAPLLDHRVVEFALRLPSRVKRRGKTTKWILRQLLYSRVPSTLVERPKAGFTPPLADWFHGPLRDQMDEYCAGTDLEDLGIDPRPVRELWRALGRGAARRPDLLWQMFVLLAWKRQTRPTRPISTAFALPVAQ
jgi:asparagine synthase (glutamine-hydrolysing)